MLGAIAIVISLVTFGVAVIRAIMDKEKIDELEDRQDEIIEDYKRLQEQLKDKIRQLK